MGAGRRRPRCPVAAAAEAYRLRKNETFGLLYADLTEFKAFNDTHGYNRGDNVIRLTATILRDAVRSLGAPGDFVAHIGGDDFVLVVDSEKIEPVSEYIISSFDVMVPLQYDMDDQERGFIEARYRRGQLRRFPIMTIAIGVATNRHREFGNYLEAADVCSQMKCYAKTFPGSSYKIDRRTTKDFEPREYDEQPDETGSEAE